MTIKTIRFPLGQHAWNSNSMAMIFPAIVNGKHIKCMVSREALEDHFGAKQSSHESAFLSNWERIKRVAQNKINGNDFLKKGFILVSTFDFQ